MRGAGLTVWSVIGARLGVNPVFYCWERGIQHLIGSIQGRCGSGTLRDAELSSCGAPRLRRLRSLITPLPGPIYR